MDTTIPAKIRNRDAIERAITGAGGIYRCAEKMGVTYQAIQKWLRNGVVPPKRVLPLERASRRPGPMVHRSKIAPDLYPRSLYPDPSNPRKRAIVSTPPAAA